jgi:3-deoxy-D-manno-octulosonic-acid transferase
MKLFLFFYELVWLLVLPLLRLSSRLKDGFEQRTLKEVTFGKVDLWIHAASAGEAFMTRQILSEISKSKNLKVLVTTNTSQGKKILKRRLDMGGGQLTVAYIPFDRPSLVRKALKIADPAVLVLVELEIWPGLMAECIRLGKKIIIVNGRMTQRSYDRYLKVHTLWKNVKPDQILAISEDDKKRLATLFDQHNAEYIPNIKFDNFDKYTVEETEKNSSRFLVLASVRQKEEKKVLWLIEQLLEEIPDLTIGLFPRHMHRLETWGKLLSKRNIGWVYKSRLQGDEDNLNVLLWDVFGELTKAYGRADATFVGGSLVPLGGQNFIEAFMNGVIPTTGPYVTNFLWAGDEVYQKGLVKKGRDEKEVLQLLLETLRSPMDKSLLEEKANHYIVAKQGGTVATCKYIEELLEGSIESSKARKK